MCLKRQLIKGMSRCSSLVVVMGNFYHNKIFQLLRRATKLDIVKVFSFTAMSTLVRMLTGLVSVKVVASIMQEDPAAPVEQVIKLALKRL